MSRSKRSPWPLIIALALAPLSSPALAGPPAWSDIVAAGWTFHADRSHDEAAKIQVFKKTVGGVPCFQGVTTADVGRELLLEVAAGLGSDVPFFLRGGTARGRGRGEVLQPVSPRRPLWYLIVWPGVRLCTADVYEEVEVPGSEARRSPEVLIEALERGDIEGVAAGMFNRLERAAVAREPAVGEALERIRRVGALGVQVSGSGSTVFGVFPDRRAADSAWSRLARRSSSEAVWVAHTVA